MRLTVQDIAIVVQNKFCVQILNLKRLKIKKSYLKSNLE